MPKIAILGKLAKKDCSFPFCAKKIVTQEGLTDSGE